MRTLKGVLLEPVMTEKSMRGRETNVYTFWVAPTTDKIEIRNAVEQLFKVDVHKVNVVSIQGKQRGRMTKTPGKLKDRKKAYVTVAPGQKIELLEEAK
jgi:large subunit ribosomal protein L23